MWSWKNSEDELHNIVRVGAPDSDVCTVDDQVKLATKLSVLRRKFRLILPVAYHLFKNTA